MAAVKVGLAELEQHRQEAVQRGLQARLVPYGGKLLLSVEKPQAKGVWSLPEVIEVYVAETDPPKEEIDHETD